MAGADSNRVVGAESWRLSEDCDDEDGVGVEELEVDLPIKVSHIAILSAAFLWPSREITTNQSKVATAQVIIIKSFEDNIKKCLPPVTWYILYFTILSRGFTITYTLNSTSSGPGL